MSQEAYPDGGIVPELLAPAGKLSVFRAVIEAGADAVYAAGKQFNMRRHRSDFNFTMEDLATATEEAHAVGKRLYVTVNSLVGQHEVAALRDYLRELDAMGVDAVIVQDLAVVALCRDMALSLPLHSSTMMNVSGVETASQLREWGFSRLVTSRDITLDEVRRIREGSGLEVEYFLHGDLCSVLSGQCFSSGMIFGKSGNRGQCMKPCRWAYDLVSEGTGETVKEGAYLLASRDMCLLQHIPRLIDARVDSLKIEGRMRPAETLVPIVEAYREAIDSTVGEPLGRTKRFDATHRQQRARTRNLTTGFAFRYPDETFMDASGTREPIIFSRHGRLRTLHEVALKPVDGVAGAATSGLPDLSVVVGNRAGAEAAITAACDWLILSWEADLTAESGWSLAELREICQLGAASGVPVMLSTPRVLDTRSTRELQQVVASGLPLAGYVAATVGALPILRPSGLAVWAGAEMNVINAEAATWLARHGVSRIMPALEASLLSIAQMHHGAPDCQFDLLAHGTLTGMLLEHCLIAMNMQHASKTDFCPMPCRAYQFSMVDLAGNFRRIRPDRYCRNHIIMEQDLATLPYLETLLEAGPASLRIYGVLYDPDTLTRLIELYGSWLRCADGRDAVQRSFGTRWGPTPSGSAATRRFRDSI